jgi:hypothetical protein
MMELPKRHTTSLHGQVTEGRLNASAWPASGPPGTRVAASQCEISLIQKQSDFKLGQPRRREGLPR